MFNINEPSVHIIYFYTYLNGSSFYFLILDGIYTIWAVVVIIEINLGHNIIYVGSYRQQTVFTDMLCKPGMFELC